MVPTLYKDQATVPPPAYHRAQGRQRPALHIDALSLVSTLHLLMLCRLAVRLAHRRCPPPLPAGPGGAPRTYSDETLLLIALLRTLWRLSRPGICTTGCKPGLLWRWLVAYPLIATEGSAFPAPLNSANATMWQEPQPMKRFLCSVYRVALSRDEKTSII